MNRFRDRADAGRALARMLQRYSQCPDVTVLALPRGGVPVAYEIARQLSLPLDVLLVRKLGVPGHEEVAMGAIASGNTRVLNEDLVAQLGIPAAEVDAVAAREKLELDRRERLYRGARRARQVADERVIVVDDGLATGATMRAAVAGLRLLLPRQVIVAVPVGSRQACDELARVADEVVCAIVPEAFQAVSAWYDEFPQATDDEVRELLARARAVAM